MTDQPTHLLPGPLTPHATHPHHRLASIDLLRGLIIALMALDHVRDLTTPQPPMMDFAHASPALFFTRWITHFCAPTFVLLAGIGAFLYGAHGRTRREVSRFLLTRGLWLVFIELTVVSFAWNFCLGAHFVLVVQVIWAIGLSMICLAGLLWLPRPAVLAVGAGMILAHNLLDGVQPPAGQASPLWLIAHIQGFFRIGGLRVFLCYPLIPWIGVMAVGYAAGPVFRLTDPARRRRTLFLTGLVLTLAFFALRIPDLYGEPNPWHRQPTLSATLVDFFDVTKYPPSLQFLCMTLGPAFLLLAAFDRAKGRLTDAFVTIGRVPFFFYIIHLYVIHTVAVLIGLAQGFPLDRVATFFFYYPQGFGLNLPAVYFVWAGVVLTLYPACRAFAALKHRRHDWWLSYL
jgi:uncharacterized membrane protein